MAIRILSVKTTWLAAIGIAVIGLFFQSPLLAEVYRWVDKNGQVNYSDRPERAATNIKRMDIKNTSTRKPVATSNSAEDSTSDTESEEQNKNQDSTTNPDTESAKAEEPKISKKEKRRLCKEGKSDYKKISSRGRMREINKKGEYIYLSEKQRQKRLAAAKKKQRKYCR
jgi:hypothetical protein